MRIVLDQGGVVEDVAFDVATAEATVADLLAAVARDGQGQRPSDVVGQEAPGVVVVDGRPFGPDTDLDELGLYDGAHVRLLDDPPSAPAGFGAVAPTGPSSSAYSHEAHDGIVLVAVGGLAAGREWPVGPVASGPGQASGARRLLVGRTRGCDVVLDDPFVSGRHAELVADTLGGVTITDLGSSNGTWLDDQPVTQPRPVRPDALIQIGGTQLRIRHVSRADRPVGLGASSPAGPLGSRGGAPGTTLFNRPPRPAPPPPPPPLTQPAAPPDRTAARRSLGIATFIGPIVMGGAMVMLYGNPRFALFALISPLAAIVSAISVWRRRRRLAKRRTSRSHRAELRRFGHQLAAANHDEVRRLEQRLPDLPEVVRRAALPSVRLWERQPHHDDWLRLRAGLGQVRWEPLLAPLRSAEPSPQAQELVEHHSLLWSAPVEVDLSPGNTVGIVGDPDRARALARALLVQAAVHHGPAHLGVTVLCRGEHVPSWDWAKWLPHVRLDAAGGLRVAGTTEVSESLLDALVEAAEQDDEGPSLGRRPLRSRRSADDAIGPTMLYVIDDVALVTGHRSPVRRLLRGTAGPAAGLVVAETEDQLPALCTTVVAAYSHQGDAELRRPEAGVRIDGLTLDGLDEPVARDCARKLSRYADPELDVAGAGLPTKVRLLDLLDRDTEQPTADAVARAWHRNAGDPRPRTPIGVDDDGPVVIDLVDDGPHALVGGTTGSGKSELLRSLVVGMASQASPEHVNFVLVDYKGGSAFDACARLPHVVGLVTDLDDHLGERALVSLEAELTHREHVLREAGASDLDAYQAAGTPRGPLPRLVVVIDEFATLVADLPDFVGSLVGIAQRGRSLGVHLVLATQRPSGSVNANIKANTNLRIALRVQDSGDSQDIIDRRDAARISRNSPGRAYIRRGHSDVVAVQTALSTGVAPTGAAVTLAKFRFAPAAGSAGAAGAGDGVAAAAETDLEMQVTAITEAYERSGLAPPRQPWLPMLPENLTLDRVLAPSGATPSSTPSGLRPDHDRNEPLGSAGVVPFALADDPQKQRRTPVGWTPAEGHLMVVGMVGSGTTTALRSLSRALAETHPADDCHIHVVDFGAGGLAEVANLPHAGAVVAAGEREAQMRLVRYLRAELDRRRQLGPAEVAAEPLVVTMVDGIAAFLAEFDGLEGAEVADGFKRVWADGPAVRLVCAVTGDRSGALPMRMTSSVSQRLLLRLADTTEFSSVGYRPKNLPAFVPGRGIDAATRLVVQVAQPGSLARSGERFQPPSDSRQPWRVRTLPAELAALDLPPASVDGGLQVPVGLAEDDLSPVALDLFDKDHAVVAGPPRSGKTSALRLIASRLRAVDPKAVLVGVCDERSALYEERDVLDAAGTAEELAKVLKVGLTDGRRWCVLVDDAGQVDDSGRALQRLLSCGRSQLHVVVAGRPHDFRSTSHWARQARRSRIGLLVQPDLTTDSDVLSVRLPRRIPVPLCPGRGFVVAGGAARLVQLALP